MNKYPCINPEPELEWQAEQVIPRSEVTIEEYLLMMDFFGCPHGVVGKTLLQFLLQEGSDSF